MRVLGASLSLVVALATVPMWQSVASAAPQDQPVQISARRETTKTMTQGQKKHSNTGTSSTRTKTPTGGKAGTSGGGTSGGSGGGKSGGGTSGGKSTR